MKTLVFLGLILTVQSGLAQKLIDGYITLKNPRRDNNIIGKRALSEVFTGTGTQSFLRYPSASKMSEKKLNEFKLEISASVEKIVESKLQLDAQAIKVTDLQGLEILECTDFSKIPELSDDNDFVIAAMVVRQFTIEKNNQADIGVDAKLDSLLKMDILDISATIDNKKDKKIIKTGEDLVVAVKLIQIIDFKAFDLPTVNIRDNSGEVFDKSTKGNVYLSFQDMDPMDETIFSTIDLLNEHKGCFVLESAFSGTNDKDGNSLKRRLIICPKCDRVEGKIPLDCEVYRPSSDFSPNQYRTIHSQVLNKSTIVNYSIRVNDLRASYSLRPKTDAPKSNYRIADVGGTVALSKRVIKYKIKTKMSLSDYASR